MGPLLLRPRPRPHPLPLSLPPQSTLPPPLGPHPLAQKDDALTEALIQAALDGYAFPDAMVDLRTSQNAYLQGKDTTAETAIRVFFTISGLAQFKKMLETDSKTELSPGLTNTLRTIFGIKVHRSPLVEGEIRDGKVYYKTINPWTGQPIHSKPKSKAGYIYDPETCFRMTPDQFNRFKLAGRRSGHNEITREQFSKSARADHETIKYLGCIWDELKNRGVLNHNNRLSSSWRNLASKELSLTSFDPTKRLTYSSIVDMLVQLSSLSYSKERSPLLCLDQKLAFYDRTKELETLAWDVGTLDELEHFKSPDNDYTFVHLPSLDTLEDFKYSSNDTIHEDPKSRIALAVPTARVDQSKSCEAELSTVDGLLAVSKTPEEVGSIRRLYRDSVKTHPPAAGHSTISTVSCVFWQSAPKERKQADRLITEELNSFSVEPPAM